MWFLPQIKLPFSVDGASAEGVIQPDSGELLVTLPFQAYSDVLQAIKRPQAVSALNCSMSSSDSQLAHAAA